MASSASNATTSTASAATTSPPTYGSDSTSLNTTFVQADPSTFRTIVQKLTGAADDPSNQRLPITHPTRPATGPGTKRPAFKLQGRRPDARNLQVNLYDNNVNNCTLDHHPDIFHLRQQGFLVSPVSPLDLFRGMSPRSPTPCENSCALGSPREVALAEEEETRAIAEKGFYLHPRPLSTPRGAEPPELLPLFPLRSPRDNDGHDDRSGHTSCS